MMSNAISNSIPKYQVVILDTSILKTSEKTLKALRDVKKRDLTVQKLK